MNPNLTDYDKILAVLVVAIAHCIIFDKLYQLQS